MDETISSTFKNDKFSEYDIKPDRPSNNSKKPAGLSKKKAKKSRKPDTDKDIEPDTENDCKPDTDKAKKPDACKGIKSDKHVNTKKDVKPSIKHDIVRLDDKRKVNELQKTFINNDPHLKKMIDSIKRIFECLICENFINEKFKADYMFIDEFRVSSEYREDTDEGYMIIVSRKNIGICKNVMDVYDVINYRAYVILIEHDRVTFSEYDRATHDDISLQVHNNKIVETTSKLACRNNTIVKEDTIEDIECGNRIRCIILRKITPIILKICERTNDNVNKNKNK